jgi:tetratricopeptide (TPR) repeat protein
MYESGEEKAKLKRQMSNEAISLAMQGRWKEAVAINQSIIESMPTDIDAYNRLGKAYMELGELESARNAYNKTLELEPNSSIAIKNLSRLSKLQKSWLSVKDDRPKAAPHLFIGEVGKAGVVSLQQLASADVTAQLTAGDQVYLKVSGHQLIVENERGEYIGQVEPHHGFRLAKLLEGGNKYAAAIVSLDNDKSKVIIREVFQDPNQAGRLSFPAKGVEDFQPHIKDAILRNSSVEEELEEASDIEEADLEESELLPDGFSIFETGISVDELDEEELLDEE